ncbi:MAG: hypothetical protein JST28_14700 [Acidobacteria bacterium]|nr:hypothetical protein [Acidobacteriota bacterium]
MTAEFPFPHTWSAEILPVRPVILPARHFVYPLQVEEVERGALEVLVRPEGVAPFLATCALGFRDPIVPTGVWSTPNPREICAIAGGYAYLIDTEKPSKFTMLPYRPVLQVHPAVEAGLLLYVGHHTILAWGEEGEAWQSPKLSDEGVSAVAIEGHTLHGIGWKMISDKEFPFTLDLRNGALINP